ncbi:MAG: hypothetical protein EHM61_26585 [Acidobacteria bacterium]|nr:MAG: hypothetical protein EHM61_26585 [Acidobacteriota bacterium]
MPSDFVLYGGTALALRLGHRISVDYDFFSNRDFLPQEIESGLAFLAGARRVQSRPNTLTLLVERGAPVRVSFFGGVRMRRVADPEKEEAGYVWVASLLDLAATKCKVVQDRAEAKDYRDIAVLIRSGIELERSLAAALAVYGPSFNPVLTLKALAFFGDGDLPSLEVDTRALLSGEVAKTSLDRIRPLPAIGVGISPEEERR